MSARRLPLVSSRSRCVGWPPTALTQPLPPPALAASRPADPREPEAAAADAGLLAGGAVVPPLPLPVVAAEDR